MSKTLFQIVTISETYLHLVVGREQDLAERRWHAPSLELKPNAGT